MTRRGPHRIVVGAGLAFVRLANAVRCTQSLLAHSIHVCVLDLPAFLGINPGVSPISYTPRMRITILWHRCMCWLSNGMHSNPGSKNLCTTILSTSPPHHAQPAHYQVPLTKCSTLVLGCQFDDVEPAHQSWWR